MSRDLKATDNYKILGCASQGSGSDDERRLVELLSAFDFQLASFNKLRKLDSFRSLLKRLRVDPHDLVVLEGTGLAAGLAVILGRILWGKRYVVSSGDAIAPFLAARLKWGTPVFSLYERLLYSCSSGFIGWTPYLVGRALTLGATMGATIPGWAPIPSSSGRAESHRAIIRAQLGLPQDAIVFGIAGSLNWSARYQYCYGLELVRAARMSKGNCIVLIVGDGSGMSRLREAAGDLEGKRVFFTGRVPKYEVEKYLAAMDVGSLPQSLDGVGSFRYTTKLPEYRAANLLIATNEIPAAYDLDRGDMLRIRGQAPWEDSFILGLSHLMDSLDHVAVQARQASLTDDALFDRERQIIRSTAFLEAVLSRCGSGRA